MSLINDLQLQCYAQSQEINELNEKLNAANERIKRLEEALQCTVIHCDYLHHRKNHQHKLGEPCPVEQLVRKAMEAKP